MVRTGLEIVYHAAEMSNINVDIECLRAQANAYARLLYATNYKQVAQLW